MGKSGVEFMREMQRHSAAVRQVSHYKGQLDPLKGDALNKAVRDTAREALSAIFTSEDSRPSPSQGNNKRIQGFGSTSYEMPSEDKKSFFTEVVNLGSASIRQGLSTITSARSTNKIDDGSYQSPNLRRSLTHRTDRPGRHERDEDSSGTWSSLTEGSNKIVESATYGQELRSSTLETNGGSLPSHTPGKSREERLLETIVTSGGMRLQPTREALQAFLTEAVKVDAVVLCQTIEMKLQSSIWQASQCSCLLYNLLVDVPCELLL